ncbi:helix-turn-helix domain-containing protein, partial [Paracoccus sp. (in: a-proteobacteria)]|uniref:helix-turn-helix domain-containing protein n=1 Tax=Paracoccus sp. TaxID=267 RepID=UPI0026DFB599
AGGGEGGFDRAERAAVIRALARVEGNVTAAARALGVGRATLYRRMGRLRIAPEGARPGIETVGRNDIRPAS